MNAKSLRFAYVCEFLLALVAIFTAWSEIGGQSALDLMHWGWKLAFGLALAASIVGYTASIVADEALWTLRSARWLAFVAALIIVMGIVTYYYALEADTTDSEENATVSLNLYVGIPTASLS